MLSRTDHINSKVSTTGTGNAVSASFTPPDNSLLVAVINPMCHSSAGNVATANSSVSGGSLTWTKRVSIDSGALGFSYSHCLEIWTAPVTTGGSMTVTHANTLDCDGADGRKTAFQIFSYTGYDTGTPTGALITGSALSDPTGALTLSGAPSTSSVVIASRSFQPDAASDVTATPGDGWTEIYDNASGAVGFSCLETQERTGSTSDSVAWTDINDQNTAVFSTLGAALEILADESEQVVEIGQATETDLAQSVGRKKLLTLTQSAETGSAQTITAILVDGGVIAIGQASELNIAQPLTTSLYYEPFAGATGNGEVLGSASWPDWSPYAGMLIYSSLVERVTEVSPGVLSVARLTDAVWIYGPNHISRVTALVAGDGVDGGGPVCRLSGPGGGFFDGYLLTRLSATEFQLRRYNNATPTNLATFSKSIAGGATVDIQLSCSGSSSVFLSAVVDGEVIGTYEDTDEARILTGNPAIFVFDGGEDESTGVLDFRAYLAPPAPQTVAIGTAQETNLARTIVHNVPLVISLGQVVETSASLDFGSSKEKDILPTEEVDTAGTMAARKSRILEAAGELDTSRHIRKRLGDGGVGGLKPKIPWLYGN